jgi:hypothetical protein
MRRPFSYKIESLTGSLLLLLTAATLLIVSWGIFSTTKSDIETISINIQFQRSEKLEEKLIDRWINGTGIKVPAAADRYDYVRKAYPQKPWLEY